MRTAILLPARGRPAYLMSSMDSVFELARRPDDVCVYVRLDFDDPHYDDVFRIAAHRYLKERVYVEVGTRLGYTKMHVMYNNLAAVAVSKDSDWLINWNDDIEWVTQGWDDLLRESPPFCIQFPRREGFATTDYTVPVIGRTLYEAMGKRLSDNAYADAWLAHTSALAQTSVARDDIVFRHHRLDDATLKEQWVDNKEWEKFETEEQKTARRFWAERISASPLYGTRFDDWNYTLSDDADGRSRVTLAGRK